MLILIQRKRFRRENRKMKRIIRIIVLTICIVPLIYFLTYKSFDPDSGNSDDNKTFVDNQVNVFFYEDVSFIRIKLFLIRINGKLDAYEIDYLNSYAITLNKTFETEEEVEKYCNSLMSKYKIIEDCFPNMISQIDDPILPVEHSK